MPRLRRTRTVNPVPPPKTEGGELALGAFVLKPPTGTVEPGEKAVVEVVFKAEDDRVFSELCGLDVSGRNPTDKPLGIVYPVAGESVIPGIAAEDFRGILRGAQARRRSGSVPLLETNAFDTTNKEFSFGPVLANLASDEEGEATPAEPELDENGEPKPVLPTGGVKANFRISNPKKVPCSVDFTPRAPRRTPAVKSFPWRCTPASPRRATARAQVRHGVL